MAEVAASMRSSQRLFMNEAAALVGSHEEAFRPSTLNRRLFSSRDFVFSCLGRLAFWVMDDFLGLGLCMGGKVVDRPGGERAIIEGSSSRWRGEWKEL